MSCRWRLHWTGQNSDGILFDSHMMKGSSMLSARLGSTITEFIYSFSKTTKRTVEKIIFFRNGLKDGQFGDICHQEMSAIKKACAYFMDGHEPRITYVVVLPHATMGMANKIG
ncbi:hypothetical protein SETIT_1G292100v2 [Setaria italica]|uniref:Piwi domain-containing protein n=1 Tax=Setaria italica TaxID=4555 RepID=A0A368PQF6_SETIT|nr:hypothetical protein SETIT_1G292100v2 [Setaria italica]